MAEPDEELTQRLQAARAGHRPPPAGVEIHLHTAVEDCHPLVRRMASRLSGKERDSRDWPTVSGQSVMAMSVSAQHQQRALLLLDSVLQRCIGAGFRVLTPKEQNAPAQIDVDGEKFTFRVSEKSEREERDLTPSERRDAELYPALYGGRKYYTFKATGILHLEITQVGSSYPIFSIRDGKTEALEQKTANLASRLEDHSLRLKVARELAQDRAKQAEVRRAEQRKLWERREAELQKLKKLEAAATEWHRAQRLRRFAAALAVATALEGGKELAGWINRAADWLDPLVKTRWAEVDDAPAKVW